MSDVSKDAFLGNVDAIVSEHPAYKLGKDGSGGECDCIGLIIGAIRRSGGSWTGTHGSNYAARSEMDYLLPVTDPDDLNAGEVVYKAAMPGAPNYALPGRYKGDPDQRDYYHVGVVRSVSPLLIVHCTSPGGIKEDTKLGNWTHRGWLRKISREGEEPMQDVTMATVVAETGSTVNMRKAPDGALIDRVPVGTQVPVTAQQDGWSRISYNGRDGWMMSSYLRMEGQEAPQQPEEDGDVWTTIRDLQQRMEAVEAALQGLGWSKEDGGFG